MLRLILAALHLLGFGMAVGSLWVRSCSLRSKPLDRGALHRAFAADSWWGIASVLSIATGLWRLFGGTEKSTVYYTHDWIFHAKMRIYGLLFLLELWPMITLIRWRSRLRRDGDSWQPNKVQANWMGTIGYVETAILIVMVFAAVSMARGYGAGL